jgi:hypothetical protein
MCLAVVSQIVRWLHGMLSCGIYLVMWWLEMLPCVIGLGEVDHWMTATWHWGGAHLSGDSCLGGAHLLAWTNEMLTHGTVMLRWPSEVLTRGTLSLFSDSVCACLRSPVCTQMSLCPPSCTQMNPWLNLSPWSPFLICFIFSEFILIAPLIQKSWNFHQKSLNSWWSSL